jgi:hypothetical protein
VLRFALAAPLVWSCSPPPHESGGLCATGDGAALLAAKVADLASAGVLVEAGVEVPLFVSPIFVTNGSSLTSGALVEAADAAALSGDWWPAWHACDTAASGLLEAAASTITPAAGPCEAGRALEAAWAGLVGTGKLRVRC